MNLGRTLFRKMFVGAIGAIVAPVACATSSHFDRAIGNRDWPAAVTALRADTALLENEGRLFKAAMLYTYPNRSTYDPDRATELFERLLRDHPNTSRRDAIIDQLSLLQAVRKSNNAVVARQNELKATIARLVTDTLTMRRSIDSISVRLQAEEDQSALLRKITARMESDIQDRDNQINVLHSELNHLKAIDLRSNIHNPSGDSARKKPRSFQ